MKFRVNDERDLNYVGGFLERLGFTVEDVEKMPNGKINFIVPGFDRKKIPYKKQGIWHEMPCWVVG